MKYCQCSLTKHTETEEAQFFASNLCSIVSTLTFKHFAETVKIATITSESTVSLQFSASSY